MKEIEETKEERMSNELTADSRIKLMHSDYCSGVTLNEVAIRHGYRSGTTVLYHFQKMGLGTRKRGGAIKDSQRGSDNGNWKGGIVNGKKEYTRIWKPDHHRADVTGYVYEHILMAEKLLGKALHKSEVVHHISGDKRDNNLSNLLVCTQKEHINLHKKGGVLCQI